MFLSALGIFSIYFDHSDHLVVSHRGFNMHFPNGKWCWISLYSCMFFPLFVSVISRQFISYPFLSCLCVFYSEVLSLILCIFLMSVPSLFDYIRSWLQHVGSLLCHAGFFLWYTDSSCGGWASVVAVCGTGVPCIARWIVNLWTIRELLQCFLEYVFCKCLIYF